MPKKPDYNRINEIFEMKQDGMTNADIARQLNISRQAVYDALKKRKLYLENMIVTTLNDLQHSIDCMQSDLSRLRKRLIEDSTK